MSNLWVLPEELGDLAESEYAYEACQSASYLMWALSGRKFTGITAVTETYSAPVSRIDSTERLQRLSGVPMPSQSARYSRTNSLRLSGFPVTRIDAVHEGSGLEPLDPEQYFVTDGSVLNLDHAISQPITVTYRYGMQPPVAGRMAARTLAQQFALLWEGSEDCELPARVTSVSRQGISYTILDQQDFVADLRTGVYAVDLFLKTVNPDRALRKSKVFSPDIQRGKRALAKPPLFDRSDRDVSVLTKKNDATTIRVSLESLGLEGVDLGTWKPNLTLSSGFSGAKRVTLGYGATIEDDETLVLSVSWDDARKVITYNNPGLWQLFAEGEDGTLTFIAMGNLFATLV